MAGWPEPTLDDSAGEEAVLRVYRQVFAVLARDAGAMTGDVATLDIDQAILDAFAEAGSQGLTVEQATASCRAWPAHKVARRFEVLREYGAISRVVDRPNERYHRAAFAPYVMLLFLRRMAEQGGQSELHQLLHLEKVNVASPNATSTDGRASLERLTKVFRLLGNDLAFLAAGGTAETLSDSAPMLWGNESLISQARDVHQKVSERWADLRPECAALRTALAAYADAIEAAAGRLMTQAGTTRALGVLPVETWRTFARDSSPAALAAVLDRFVFDAPAPSFPPQMLIEAVETGWHTGTVRLPPPRTDDTTELPGDEPAVTAEAADADDLRMTAEQLLGEACSVKIPDLLLAADGWKPARRILATLTAIHHHPDLPYELVWSEHLRIDPNVSPSWISDGHFRRTDRKGGEP